MDPRRQHYLVEATRVHGFHTYKRVVKIRSTEAQAQAYQRGRGLVDQAARRGYDAKLTHIEDSENGRILRVLYEVAAHIQLPWANAR